MPIMSTPSTTQACTSYTPLGGEPEGGWVMQELLQAGAGDLRIVITALTGDIWLYVGTYDGISIPVSGSDLLGNLEDDEPSAIISDQGQGSEYTNFFLVQSGDTRTLDVKSGTTVYIGPGDGSSKTAYTLWVCSEPV